jgi:hypothetical protein
MTLIITLLNKTSIDCCKLSHLKVKLVLSNVILSNFTRIECYEFCHYK